MALRAAYVGPGSTVLHAVLIVSSDGTPASLKCPHLDSQPTAFLSIIIKEVTLAVTTALALILKSFLPPLPHLSKHFVECTRA